MKKYQPPTREFFRLPNKIFQVPLDATQFKLYSYPLLPEQQTR